MIFLQSSIILFNLTHRTTPLNLWYPGKRQAMLWTHQIEGWNIKSQNLGIPNYFQCPDPQDDSLAPKGIPEWYERNAGICTCERTIYTSDKSSPSTPLQYPGRNASRILENKITPQAHPSHSNRSLAPNELSKSLAFSVAHFKCAPKFHDSPWITIMGRPNYQAPP